MARLPKGVTFATKNRPGYGRVLTAGAAGFLASLARTFGPERQRLLSLRAARQKRFDKGELPDFLPETAAIRAGSWRVAPIPADLQDRRVGIVAATGRRPMITALNSGARLYLADFEDSNAPTWDNMVQGQVNLMDRWTSAMEYIDPATGKRQALGQKPAVLMVRPRGWHLDEAHMKVDGKPMPASLFDFGLYFFHNAKTALAKGSGPYFSLPKIESHIEARLWNAVFVAAQSLLGLPLGTIKATVAIETVPAAFEMDEIVYELRDHMAGLDLGRLGYVFSLIKTFAGNRSFILPGRAQLEESQSFLAALPALLVRTCHRRGCHAMGGRLGLAGSRKDHEANQSALDALRAAIERDARSGHDGVWVAQAELVPAAMKLFNDLMPTPNQLYVSRDDATIGQKELLGVESEMPTGEDLRDALRTGVHYFEAWLCGRGTVAVGNLLEDTAAAELARALAWQWLRAGVRLDGGAMLTRTVFERCLAAEMERLRDERGAAAFDKGSFREAAALFKSFATAKDLAAFFTPAAYRKIM